MPGRKYAAGSLHRYGFNGKENDNEVDGEGGQQDYGMRIYDPRIGRFLSVDPKFNLYPDHAPYSYAINNPLKFVDKDGAGPDLPPFYVTIQLFLKHPTAFYALYMSNNTSPHQFYLFANNQSSEGTFNKLIGAFGEAEVFKRLMTDFTVAYAPRTNTIPGPGVPIVGTEMGKRFKGKQVDIQSTMQVYTSGNILPGLTTKHALGIRSYNFDGSEKPLDIYTDEGYYTINYEVKNFNPLGDVETMYYGLVRGLQQIDERSEGSKTIGILVVDSEVWKKVANDPVFGKRLKLMYGKFINYNKYLRLEENLYTSASRELWSAYDTVREAIKEKGLQSPRRSRRRKNN